MNNTIWISIVTVAIFIGAEISGMVYIPILNGLNAENARLHYRLTAQRDDIAAVQKMLDSIQQSQNSCGDVLESLGIMSALKANLRD